MIKEFILPESKYLGKVHNINISEDYVPKWTYIESIREVFQNFRDACVCRAMEKGLKIIMSPLPQFDKCDRIDDPENYDKMYVKSFEFKSENEEILGWITYDLQKFEAVFHNQKAIPRESITTIGSTDKLKNENMTGKHGEGAKLGGLAIIRNSDRQYTIFSEGKKWKFVLEKTNINDKNRKLCVVEENLNNPNEFTDETRVIIEKLKVGEWISACQRILNFCNEDERKLFIKPFKFGDEGELLITTSNNSRFKSKLYVKNLFVQEEIKEYHELNYFGLNLFKIDLDRDRNSIASSKERNISGSKILADISCNFDDFENSVKDIFNKDLFFKNIFQLLISYNLWMSHYASSLLQFEENKRKNAADIIFRLFLSHVNRNPFIQPMELSEYQSLAQKRLEYGFSDSFYQYYPINNSHLMPVLKMSRLYESLETRINKKLINAPLSQPGDGVNQLLSVVKDKFNLVSPEYSENLSIYFKEFSDINHRYKKGKEVFISHHIFLNENDETEIVRKVFSKLLEIFNISYERIIYCFVRFPG